MTLSTSRFLQAAALFLVLIAPARAEMSRAQGQCIAAALDHDEKIDTVEDARAACAGVTSVPQALCAGVALGKKHGTVTAIRDALTACATAASEGQVLCMKAGLAHDEKVNSIVEALKKCGD